MDVVQRASGVLIDIEGGFMEAPVGTPASVLRGPLRALRDLGWRLTEEWEDGPVLMPGNVLRITLVAAFEREETHAVQQAGAGARPRDR